MSLNTLNYPLHLFGKLNKQRILHKMRIDPVLDVIPVPERDNKPVSTKSFGSNLASVSSMNPIKGSLLQPNTVGIIGGVSADATLECAKKLVNWSNKCIEDEYALPFILCSDGIPNKGNDDTKIVETLRRKRIFLERSGARCIVMPCHISHSWYDDVSKGCSVPVLHMGEGECVAKELKEAKLKPLEAGSPLRIGILATNEILKGGVLSR